MKFLVLNSPSTRIATLAIATTVCFGSVAHAVEIYSDNFDNNTNDGWTYLDRSSGTALAPTTGGGPGSPSFAEQNMRLEQTVTNYSFPDNGGPSLGGIALSGSGVVGGIYSISVDMVSLEPGNGFQDQDIVFGYTDEDNFFYVETIANGGLNLFSVAAGVCAGIGNGSISFSHDPTTVVLSVDTAAGDVSVNYGGAGDVSLATGLALNAGLNGVGSNNDAFAIDNYVINQIPEPTSLAVLAIGTCLAVVFRRRR